MDFTPGGGDTGTVLISPLITPGTVSSTYYNHYSTLRTLEDLLLTGQTCTDTPLVAGTVCGGLDGKGHLGYAAQAGLATFGPDVFTAQSFQPVNSPPGFIAVGGSGSTTVYCPANSPLGQAGSNAKNGGGLYGGTGGTGGAAGCGTSGGNGGSGGEGSTSAGSGGNGGNGGIGACTPEQWSSGMWLTSTGTQTQPYDTPPCSGNGGNGGNGGRGGNGSHLKPGGNGGNGADGTPGTPGANGANGANGG